jgi:hypothetical protein
MGKRKVVVSSFSLTFTPEVLMEVFDVGACPDDRIVISAKQTA